MSLSNQFKTDKKAETEGIRVEYAENEDGTIPTFIIGRANRTNRRYSQALERLTKPHRRALEMKTLPKEKAEEIWRDVFIEGNLHGWENVRNSDVTGNKQDEGYAEFTKDNAISLFKNLPDLYDDLSARANDAANFRVESMEEEAKN